MYNKKSRTERKYNETLYALTFIMLQNLLSVISRLLQIFKKCSNLLKFGENVALGSNSLYPSETPSYSASHLAPSYLHFDITVALSMISVNIKLKQSSS